MTGNYSFNKTLKELYPEYIFSDHLFEDEDKLETINHKILREYSNYDIVSIISEGLCLEVLVPFAIDILQENAFEQGDIKPGDMLDALLNLEKDFWINNEVLKESLHGLLNDQIAYLSKALKALDF